MNDSSVACKTLAMLQKVRWGQKNYRREIFSVVDLLEVVGWFESINIVMNDSRNFERLI